MAKREHTISKASKEIPMCMAVLIATTKPIGVTTDKYFLDTALTAVQRWRTEDEILNLIRSIYSYVGVYNEGVRWNHDMLHGQNMVQDGKLQALSNLQKGTTLCNAKTSTRST